MAKYNQSSNLYENNEYNNMPSIGLRSNRERLTTKSVKQVDWDKVKEIVNKYGFKYCLISDTFCSYGEYGVFRTNFVVYYQLPITNDWFEENKGTEVFWEKNREFYPIYKKLHDCVHELDEETELYFNCSWSGNVGPFASDDVERQTYSFGDRVTTWKELINEFPPTIYNINSQMKKGVYAEMCSKFLKGNESHEL